MNSSVFKNARIQNQQDHFNKKSQHRHRGNDDNLLIGRQNVEEEDKMSEDISNSQRARNEEANVRAMHEHYRQEEPESKNVENMLKAGAKTKPGSM